ncbi:flavoprotein%2C HI0933 family [Bordetella pertussis]|nr:flavoprotein%2C HI0933 family [Bordetella pertussis]
MPDRTLRALAALIHDWRLVPSGTAGYKKAEVMRGLGGYNFQWAWASGYACGNAL